MAHGAAADQSDARERARRTPTRWPRARGSLCHRSFTRPRSETVGRYNNVYNNESRRRRAAARLRRTTTTAVAVAASVMGGGRFSVAAAVGFPPEIGAGIDNRECGAANVAVVVHSQIYEYKRVYVVYIYKYA